MTPGENTDPFVKGPEPRTGNAQGRGERRPAGPDAASGEPSLTREGTPESTPPAGGAVEKERDEYLELAQRTKADFENYRKRMGAENQAALGRGKAEVLRDVLPVLDDLERAIGVAGLDPEGDSEDALAHGVLLVFRGLREALGRHGVEAVDPRGEKFDPTLHEALSTRSVEGAETGTVVEVFQKGYRLDGQVLRAAKVVVSE